jgi:putative transposase
MARKTRIEYEGAFYHVIIRGNQRQKVFKDEEDFQKYLTLLAFYRERYKYFLYAYVLMNNHVHLLIETRKIPLFKIIQGISQSYTMYFNRKYRTVGHLFQGRYKAIVCDKDEYLLSLVKYIHLNPVRARIAKEVGEYRWSSEESYSGKRKGDIVDTDQVLRMFSEDKSQARKLYRAYIDDGTSVKKQDIYGTIGQRILGDEQFVETVMERIEGGIEGKKRWHGYSFEEITKAVEHMSGTTLRQLRDKSRGRNILTGRKLASLAAKGYGYKGKEIAAYLRKDPSVITRYLKEGERFRVELEQVLKTLSGKKAICNKQV